MTHTEGTMQRAQKIMSVFTFSNAQKVKDVLPYPCDKIYDSEGIETFFKISFPKSFLIRS